MVWGFALGVTAGWVAGVLGTAALLRRSAPAPEREERYKSIFDNVADALYLLEVTSDGRFRNLEVNAAFERSSGMRSADLVGRFIEETVPAETAAAVAAKYRRCIDSGTIHEEDIVLNLPNGRRHYHSTLVPIRDTSGRVHRIAGISRDVTEAKLAEEALRRSEELHRTLVENAPGMIMRYDLEGRRIYVNPAYVRATGLARDAAVGALPGANWRGTTTMGVEQYLGHLRRAMRTGEPGELEIGWPRSDDDPAQGMDYHALRVVPERDGQGRICGAMVIGHDITALKETQHRLEESRLRLSELGAKAERARDEERRRVAHELHDELGQVLTALRLGAATMRMQFGGRDAELDRRIRDQVALAEEGIAAVRGVAYSLRPAALEAGIVPALEWLAAEFTRASGVPSEVDAPDAPLLDDDRAMALFRLVQEGLTNVARHAAAGRVHVRLGSDAAGWELELRDDGRGFAPAARGEGTLGLLGMRERIGRLGGELRIDSAPGNGTRILARLPRPVAVPAGEAR